MNGLNLYGPSLSLTINSQDFTPSHSPIIFWNKNEEVIKVASWIEILTSCWCLSSQLMCWCERREVWTWRGLIRACLSGPTMRMGHWLIIHTYECSNICTLLIIDTHTLLRSYIKSDVAKCWISQLDTASGIWGTLNTIAVRQLGIDFQYIQQIKSFDNNPTSQLLAFLGRDGYSLLKKKRRLLSRDSIYVKPIMCAIKWNRLLLLAFLCISRVKRI